MEGPDPIAAARAGPSRQTYTTLERQSWRPAKRMSPTRCGNAPGTFDSTLLEAGRLLCYAGLTSPPRPDLGLGDSLVSTRLRQVFNDQRRRVPVVEDPPGSATTAAG
jgi:hypothetical protein